MYKYILCTILSCSLLQTSLHADWQSSVKSSAIGVATSFVGAMIAQAALVDGNLIGLLSQRFTPGAPRMPYFLRSIKSAETKSPSV